MHTRLGTISRRREACAKRIAATSSVRCPAPRWLARALRFGALGAAALCGSLPFAHAAVQSPTTFGDSANLGDLSLEQLGSIEITSVSRRSERLLDAAASIYVVTAEDMRRAGVNSLPEALRLAPNLQVARMSTSQYAVSARGFNNAIGNKLLVLLDGRTLYTPLFSGVFWEQQDTLFEDVDRIEVISGPGATLWGANAVNGVINIITRPAKETQGTLAVAGGGNNQAVAAARHGGMAGNGAFRVYAKQTQIDRSRRGDGVPDGWRMRQAGFRSDWQQTQDTVTLQGDAYRGRSEHRGFAGTLEIPRVEVSGANLLARWSRRHADGGESRLQAYADRAKRMERILFQPDAKIFDVEFQRGSPHGAHYLMWGAGYRHAEDKVEPGLIFRFLPPDSRLAWTHLFIQDEIKLADNLEFTAGVKLERNDYTGWEYLPSARLAWSPAANQLVWSAVSRAVRAPSRLDREVFFPLNPPFAIAGGPDFQSEIANVLELGYRAQPAAVFNYSITAFYNDWDRVRSGDATRRVIANGIEGSTRGVEAWASWQAARAWRLTAGFTTLQKKLRVKRGIADSVGANNPNLANDPKYQVTLRSAFNPTERIDVDMSVRRVGRLPNPIVPAYTAVDARIGWRVNRDVDLSLALENLTDQRHIEFGNPAQTTVFGRAAFLKLAWKI